MRELTAVLLLKLILNVNAAIDVWLRAGDLNVSDVPESLVSATMEMKQEGFEAELQTQPIPRIDTFNFKVLVLSKFLITSHKMKQLNR